MPLLDHFHAPLAPRRHWESFHVNWAGAMADALNERLLSDGYFAEEHARPGAGLEIDVATFDDPLARPTTSGTSTAVAPRVWTPPTPTVVLPAAFPEEFEVLVFDSEGGARLVAAIELVSPANKDRSTHRQAFVIQCASYLCRGISLVIIDIVTSRRGNLHNEMMQLLGHGETFALPATVLLYAVAYRPIVRGGKEQIDVWSERLAVGQPLPVMPLALTPNCACRSIWRARTSPRASGVVSNDSGSPPRVCTVCYALRSTTDLAAALPVELHT